jgi:hypothetical protein
VQVTELFYLDPGKISVALFFVHRFSQINTDGFVLMWRIYIVKPHKDAEGTEEVALLFAAR